MTAPKNGNRVHKGDSSGPDPVAGDADLFYRYNRTSFNLVQALMAIDQEAKLLAKFEGRDLNDPETWAEYEVCLETEEFKILKQWKLTFKRMKEEHPEQFPDLTGKSEEELVALWQKQKMELEGILKELEDISKVADAEQKDSLEKKKLFESAEKTCGHA